MLRKYEILKRQLLNRIDEQKLQVGRIEVERLKILEENDRLDAAEAQAQAEIEKLQAQIEQIGVDEKS